MVCDNRQKRETHWSVKFMLIVTLLTKFMWIKFGGKGDMVYTVCEVPFLLVSRMKNLLRVRVEQKLSDRSLIE